MTNPRGEVLSRVCIVGGAGFIGSHFVDRLLSDGSTSNVVVYDNFSSGRERHLSHHESDPRLTVVRGEASDEESLLSAMRDCRTVIHLASNPDISLASSEPSVDFTQGTLLTHHVVEAARRSGIELVLYASGSGVYGDVGALEVDEDYGPLVPISTYGASKLAGEALLAAYSHMFGLSACCFRFANVVGPRQTHGVGFDFVRRLLVDRERLVILGDGTQSKSYIHVSDVVDAVLTAAQRSQHPFSVFNVATGDYLTVLEIAEMAAHVVGADSVKFEFTGGDRGWRGDVPIVRVSSDRIRSLGWSNKLNARGALETSLLALLEEAVAEPEPLR